MDKKMSTEEMQALLQADKVQRERECLREYGEMLQALYDKYQCAILPVPFIRPDGGIDAQIIARTI